MSDMNTFARPSSGAVLAAALTLTLAGFASAGHAATTLQQLLATIDASPMLVYDGLYLNYSEMLALDAQATTMLVDGSVIIAHNAEATIVGQATTPGTGPVTETAVPRQLLPLTVDTNVIGGSNVGMIGIDHNLYLATPLDETEAAFAVPGRGIMALNATSTQAQVVGSVTMLSNSTNPPATKITTSAIGASNIGAISIILRNNVSHPAGP